MSPRDAVTRISKLLVISYIIDWAFVVGVALIGYGFYKVDPNHHAFSLADPSISYPYKLHETVPTHVLIIVSLLVPAAIIVIIALAVTPGSPALDGPKPSGSQTIRSKLWEWNAGWLGLVVALAGVWVSTQGLKDLAGKPRPDMLARCNPDVSKVAQYAVGGLGNLVQGAPTLVSWEICRNKSPMLRIDGFSSFPSGHSSFSFAGLGYLTLWLAAKFSIGFPYLPVYPVEGRDYTNERTSVRSRGAAPPVLHMIIAFVPLAVAFFISASRWMDYRHHGFDILFGSTMGAVFAYIGFRMYHLPIQRGAGWSWGPRTRRRAFMRGFGFPSSLGIDSWTYTRDSYDDLSNGYSAESGVEHIPMTSQPATVPPTERV